MENNFGQPQSVVVLGGSSDIARALTKRLCAARANAVVLCGRSQTLLDEAAEEAKDYGATTTATVLFDAQDVTDAQRVVTESFEKVGGSVDLVVVAVGLLGDQFAQENDPAAAARVALVNFAWPVAALAASNFGLVQTVRCRGLATHHKRLAIRFQGHFRIVNIAIARIENLSVLVVHTIPFHAADDVEAHPGLVAAVVFALVTGDVGAFAGF